MTNFEKFKKELTVEKLLKIIEDISAEGSASYDDFYELISSIDRGRGAKKWLESEAK